MSERQRRGREVGDEREVFPRRLFIDDGVSLPLSLSRIAARSRARAFEISFHREARSFFYLFKCASIGKM